MRLATHRGAKMAGIPASIYVAASRACREIGAAWYLSYLYYSANFSHLSGNLIPRIVRRVPSIGFAFTAIVKNTRNTAG